MFSSGATLALFALLSIKRAAAQNTPTCYGDRPLTMCCLAVSPWYTNSNIWGNFCGYTPSDPNELIGGRCITISSGSCPTGSVGTCCSGRVPGPSGQCALGTNCGTPTSQPPAVPAPIPSGWSVVSPCAQDSTSRALLNDVLTSLANNTPANCIAHCAAQGYSFAGVEYGNECHCGTGVQGGTPTDIDSSQCHTRCTGNIQYTCGGSYAIQLYAGPTQTESIPPPWTPFIACAADTPERVLLNDQITILNDNTPAKCVEHCAEQSFPYAGVEFGDECHCGIGFVDDVVPESRPTSECSMPCAGNNGLTCGESWRIQLYHA